MAESEEKNVSYAIDRTLSIDGVSSQRIVLSGPANEWRGVWQSGFEVVGGKEYAGYAWIKAEPANQRVSFTLERRDGTTLARSEASLQPGDWHRYDFKITPVNGLHPAVFRILFNHLGIVWIGGASLMPGDHIDGFRREVLELAKTMAPPILRWPGRRFSGYL